jgi:hypothetical protein
MFGFLFLFVVVVSEAAVVIVVGAPIKRDSSPSLSSVVPWPVLGIPQIDYDYDNDNRSAVASLTTTRTDRPSSIIIRTIVVRSKMMMNDTDVKKYGGLALALCLGGLVAAVTLGVAARLLHYNADMPAYLVFLGFQVAGFVLGIVSRQEVLGKTASITSAVLALGSILFL